MLRRPRVREWGHGWEAVSVREGRFVMRNTLVTGVLLAAAVLFTVLLGSWFDLETNETALLGVASGAVVVLAAPAGHVGRSLGAFVLGVFLTLIGYVVRAALLPDTSGGVAAFGVIVILLCTLAAVATRQRLTLWALLLGAASFAGAFETAYNAAPPQVATTSMTTLTTLALCAAVGFLAASLAAPRPERLETAPPPAAPNADDAPEAHSHHDDTDEHTDEHSMEKAQ